MGEKRVAGLTGSSPFMPLDSQRSLPRNLPPHPFVLDRMVDFAEHLI